MENKSETRYRCAKAVCYSNLGALSDSQSEVRFTWYMDCSPWNKHTTTMIFDGCVEDAARKAIAKWPNVVVVSNLPV